MYYMTRISKLTSIKSYLLTKLLIILILKVYDILQHEYTICHWLSAGF